MKTLIQNKLVWYKSNYPLLTGASLVLAIANDLSLTFNDVLTSIQGK